MTKSETEPEIVKREIGEHVKLKMVFDKDSVKAIENDGDGILEAIITTSGQDRHSESIVTSGIDTGNYMEKNPVVLYGHDYFGLPIGKTLKLTQLKNQIKAKFQLAIEDYPFAADVYRMVQAGFLNAVSIGGIVREWSEDYRTILQMEMLEFSIVSIPANPDAMITQRSFEDAAGKSIEEIAKDYDQFTQQNMVDKLKTMGDDDINQSVKVLENLLAIFKESASDYSSEGEVPETVKHIKKVRLINSAKAVNQESERVIRLIKLKP